MEIAWTVVSIAAPVVLGIGYVMVSLTPADFRSARACFVLAAAMVLAMAIVWTVLTDLPLLPRVVAVDASIVIGIATLLPAGLLWISQRQRLVQTIPVSLYLETTDSKLPTHSRDVLGTFELINSSDGVGSLGVTYSPEHPHDLPWPTNGEFALDAIRVELTNYSNVPVANIEVTFDVVFRKSLRTDAADVLATGLWSPGQLTKLDPNEHCVLFLYNKRDVFVAVTAPDKASYELLNDRTRRTVTFPPRPREFVLFNVPKLTPFRGEQASAEQLPQPPHNLLCIETRVRPIYFKGGGLISTRPVEGGQEALAAIAVFANMPRTDRKVGAAKGVRAIVAPVASQLRIPSGYWLDEQHNSVDFEPGCPARELVLVYVDNDEGVWALEDCREPVGRQNYPHHHQVFGVGHMMGGLSVTVQLAAATGEVLNKSALSVDLYPVLIRPEQPPLEVILFHQEQFVDGKAVEVSDADGPMWRPRSNGALPVLPLPVIARSSAVTPDVRLEGTFPGDFKLHARGGHACEIRTGPIVTESAIVGTMRDGERTMRVAQPRYAVEFPVVSDLHDGDDVVVPPTLFCGEGYSRGAWPEKESQRTGMAEFFRNAQFVRSRENGELDVTTLSDVELETIAERRRQPHEFPFDITFWNGAHTQQWTRREVLIYEPQTNTAFVRHAGRPELVSLASGQQRPVAALELLCDHNHAELVVRNDGAIADFYGKLRIKGNVLPSVEQSTFRVYWSEASSAKARIAKGESCRLLLAQLIRESLPSLGFEDWHIYAIANGSPVTIRSQQGGNRFSQPQIEAPDIILEGEIIADPDLSNGIQTFRVVLKAFEATCG